MREEADILNYFWKYAITSINIKGHPYYQCIGQDIKALVRGYKDETPTVNEKE